jgi:hypothetical protein
MLTLRGLQPSRLAISSVLLTLPLSISSSHRNCAQYLLPICLPWQPSSIGRERGAVPWIEQSLALACQQIETHGAHVGEAEAHIARISHTFGIAPQVVVTKRGDGISSLAARCERLFTFTQLAAQSN